MYQEKKKMKVKTRTNKFTKKGETMKTAIYIEDGVVQLIITPESEFEKNALSSFQNKEVETKIFSGSFYDCRGGWVRQSNCFTNSYFQDSDRNDESIILKINKEPDNKC